MEYEQSLVSTFFSDPRKLFDHLKGMSNPVSSTYPIVHDSKQVACSEIKAQLFNEYFNSVFTVSDFTLPPVNELPTPSDQLSSIDIDLADVADALHHLNTSKAPGTDGVYPLILKVCSESISVPILHLINESMKSCSLPDEWKVHKIVPVPKTSDLSRVQNYRPISLLCILSKVLESIVYSKIIDFIRPQILNFQFGFLSNRSCLTQLLSSFSYIFSSIESKHPCDVVFLDFVKAFDTIPHQELLFKLWLMA